MKSHIEHTETTQQVALAAKPPPHIRKEPEPRLFQTEDELRTRYADLDSAKERIVRGAVALIAGLLIFGGLYGAIIFLE